MLERQLEQCENALSMAHGAVDFWRTAAIVANQELEGNQFLKEAVN